MCISIPCFKRWMHDEELGKWKDEVKYCSRTMIRVSYDLFIYIYMTIILK